jgi:primosomal protein N' (replication factor Y)
MLPPGFERNPVTFLSRRPALDEFDPSSLNIEQRHAIEMLEQQGRLSLKELQKDFGKKKGQSLASQLVIKGLAERNYELEPVKVRPKIELHLSLAVEVRKALPEAARLFKDGNKKQAALLNLLSRQSTPIPISEARKRASTSKAIADVLVTKGLVRTQSLEVKRDPLSGQEISLSTPPTISPDQNEAFKALRSSLLNTDTEAGPPDIFLLLGVTGSGKTEIYLQTLGETVRLGKKGIVLVPEISLTPQTIERFASRFPGKVAVLHSRLSLGEQFDEWHRIKKGEFDVVIGPRSALFAPQPDLGLIILDEEHEWTYKQHEQAPRYHARRVASRLAELTGATVVLGSATPDVESYYHTQKEDYNLLRLPERVTPSHSSPLPRVEIVDLREELKAGNRSIFSRSLSQAVTRAVASSEQVMLFLNRRGGETFVQCRDCGLVLRCRRCDVPLTHHLAENALVCHQCNRRIPVPEVCPRCGSRRIKFLGVGTERLEQEASRAFPGARLLRWDSDVIRGRYSHQEILDRFRAHKADILIGTQMISKGHDLPQVTLVGVVNADTALNLPDFRAGERTFQLLSQVAGRAGRGPLGGRVIIQTYSPEHYAIQAAARHDYEMFYRKEVDYRRQLHNPPFSQLASLTYSHTNEGQCRKEAERMKRVLTEELDARGIPDLDILGPAPAFIQRLRGRFRWQLILRGHDLQFFLSPVPLPQGWTVDIEPVGL